MNSTMFLLIAFSNGSVVWQLWQPTCFLFKTFIKWEHSWQTIPFFNVSYAYSGNRSWADWDRRSFSKNVIKRLWRELGWKGDEVNVRINPLSWVGKTRGKSSGAWYSWNSGWTNNTYGLIEKSKFPFSILFGAIFSFFLTDEEGFEFHFATVRHTNYYFESWSFPHNFLLLTRK